MNERRLFQIKSRRERYEVRDDVVRLKGLEPTRIAAREPKSRMSANSITGAYSIQGRAARHANPLQQGDSTARRQRNYHSTTLPMRQ